MERVGCADVDCCYRGIGQRRPVLRLAAAVDYLALDVTEPAQGFQMNPAHKAGSDNGGLHLQTHQAAAGCSRMTIWFKNEAARARPSSGESRLSSCSMESTES